MAVATIELAFTNTYINSLKGEIIACNSTAVRLADAIGWKKLQVLEKRIVRLDESHDVIVNSYERQDWNLFLNLKSNKIIEQSRKLYVISGN
jgi:RimJ/RimL family protein N-acetyltransferase